LFKVGIVCMIDSSDGSVVGKFSSSSKAIFHWLSHQVSLWGNEPMVNAVLSLGNMLCGRSTSMLCISINTK
jgi:hypothetical protein